MKIIVISILCIFSLKANCQIKNVFCEYHIVSVIYKNDTLKFNFPEVITLKEFGSTSIIPLFSYGQNKYGIKLELLKSNVGLQDQIILSKCFYIKEGNSWKEIFKSASLQREVHNINPCDLTKNRSWLNGIEAGEGEFSFSYMHIIYAY